MQESRGLLAKHGVREARKSPIPADGMSYAFAVAPLRSHDSSRGVGARDRPRRLSARPTGRY